MICSANEVMTLATKAARGGGAPPAQATQFGGAALAHLIAARTISDLSNALIELPMGPIITHPLRIQELFEAVKETSVPAHVPYSDLLRSYLEALPYDAKVISEGDRLRIRLSNTMRQHAPPVSRFRLPQNLFAQMQTLAARTLVPDTAASRQSGAGAGLTDND